MIEVSFKKIGKWDITSSEKAARVSIVAREDIFDLKIIVIDPKGAQFLYF